MIYGDYAKDRPPRLIVADVAAGALRTELNRALAAQREAIADVLRAYGLPLK
jgi:hypothetical protein